MAEGIYSPRFLQPQTRFVHFPLLRAGWESPPPLSLLRRYLSRVPFYPRAPSYLGPLSLPASGRTEVDGGESRRNGSPWRHTIGNRSSGALPPTSRIIRKNVLVPMRSTNDRPFVSIIPAGGRLPIVVPAREYPLEIGVPMVPPGEQMYTSPGTSAPERARGSSGARDKPISLSLPAYSGDRKLRAERDICENLENKWSGRLLFLRGKNGARQRIPRPLPTPASDRRYSADCSLFANLFVHSSAYI